MKRQEFIKELTAVGCYLKRHGANHDIYVNQKNGEKAPYERVIPGTPYLIRLIILSSAGLKRLAR